MTQFSIFHHFLCRLEGEIHRKTTEFEQLESKARRERLTLENQLDVEKTKFDTEKKKLQAQLETSAKEKVTNTSFQKKNRLSTQP